jgi:molybdate transport system substrate-binding protein
MMNRTWARLIRVAIWGLALACISGVTSASARAQLRIISANPVEAAIHELAERFERESGNEVTVEVMGTGAINQLLASDEVADVVVGTTASVDQAIADGQASGTKTNIARVGIGVIVRDGAPVPNVATPDQLRQAALSADALIFNTAGSGRYVDRMFVELGIGDEVTAKSARPGNGAQTMERVIGGSGNEIGFGLLSEIKPSEGEGIQLVGRLPEDVQNYTVYDGIVLGRSPSAEISRDFIQYLTTQEARQVFAETGVD